MKKLLLLLGVLAPCFSGAQTFTSIATDPSGDDYSHNPDAAELFYSISPNEDTLYIKLSHHKVRPCDFGYAIALDTNLDPNDGKAVFQTNLFSGSANTSMNYDLVIYVYQNCFFPGLYVETFDAQFNVWSVSMSVDTSDAYSIILGIPIADLDGKNEFNLLGFTGSFDIGPGGSGPGDVIPNSTFAQIRTSSVGQPEFKLSSSIYPNPARDFFQLDYQGEIKIYDTTGKLIFQRKIDGGEVDCSGLKPGLYLIYGDGLMERLVVK